MSRLGWLAPWCLALLFGCIAASVLTGNPFGNNPDIVGDESYFLTSALDSIEHASLPGLDFAWWGNYYGGPQTYFDTAVTGAAVGADLALHRFARTATEVHLALNTGYLLALLRLANGLLVVAYVGFMLLYFFRRRPERPVALALLLLLLLLFGNSLIAGLVHTAKVWTWYILCDVTAGVFFIANDYYLARYQKPFVEKPAYLAILTWSAAIAFFQNYVGLFPILLWMLWALLLQHYTLRDLFAYLRRSWWLFAGFALLQLSFLWRAAFVRYHPTWWDPGDVSTRTATQAADWVHRLANPIAFAVMSQPLLAAYIADAAIAFVVALRRGTDPRQRLYLAIAIAHPLLVYLGLHVLLGFSLFPRYALPFTVALSFSLAMLVREAPRLLAPALSAALLLCAIVTFHAFALYSRPASDVLLTERIVANYNDPTNVFIIEPDAWHLALPLNAPTLAHLNARHQPMGRYAFLAGHLGAAQPMMPFEPTVYLTDATTEAAADVAAYATSSDAVWTISTDCAHLCTARETAAGACFMLNLPACGAAPQEPTTLLPFLSYAELGNAYIVRRVH